MIVCDDDDDDDVHDVRDDDARADARIDGVRGVGARAAAVRARARTRDDGR